MIDSGEVTVTPLARDLAAPILKTFRFVPLRLARSTAFVEAGLLPAPIREGYGLSLGRPTSAVLAVGGSTSRALWKRLPRRLRAWPAARSAERTLA
jgi:hypothetical protein